MKSLLVLKCVSKSLNSLISDPKFVKNHLHLSQTRPYHLLIRMSELLLVDSRLPSVTAIIPDTTHNFRLNPSDNHPIMIDSCDGIICFENRNNNHVDLVVWNPCTGKFKILPPLENIPNGKTHTLYSIGYDRFVDNYKVVAVSCHRQINKSYKYCNSQVRVHTLGTNFWRRIPNFPSNIMGLPNGYVGKFVSGTINWAIENPKNYDSWVILSLDLGNESYQEISRPDFGLDDPVHIFTLGVSKDCLCVLVYTETLLGIWVMKDYGNKNSWTKLFAVPYAKVGYHGFGFVDLHYISEEDDQVFLHFCSKVYVYNYKNSTVKTLDIQGQPSILYNSSRVYFENLYDSSGVYVESLISP